MANVNVSRPVNVPSEARYAELERWFEVGELKDGRRFGPLRAYRPDDGSLLMEARFDAEGRLQGTLKRYHRDGSIARECTYNAGDAVGRWTYRRGPDDVFPIHDPRVAEAIVSFAERTQPSWLLLDAKGREVVAGEAIDESAGWADPLFEGASPDNVLSSGALGSLSAKLPAAPPVVAPTDGFFAPVALAPREAFSEATYRNLFGEVPPADLVAFFWAFAKEPRRFGDDNGVTPIATPLLAVKDKPFEALLAEHQAAPGRATGLRELFSGLVPLATHASGLRYAACVLETRFNRPTNGVYVFDPADNDFDIVARTVEDFAFLLAVEGAAASGALSRRGLDRAYEKLRGRVDPFGPFEELFERIAEERSRDIEGDENEDHVRGFRFQRPFQAPAFLFHRSRWLHRLLLGQADGAYQSFRPNLDGGLNEERFGNLRKTIPNEGMLGAYWLLRTYFLGDERIAEMVSWCDDSPSSLSREVATLVRDLISGKRKSLGTIDDVPALRSAFLSLSPLEKKEQSADDDEEEADDDEDDDEEDDDEEESDDDE